VGIAGALLLTAGYGTRNRPLSLLKPKCLLPWGEGTVLRWIASIAVKLSPEILAANVSRCPGDVREVIGNIWPASKCRLYFEERPLGVTATLARNSRELAGGTWLVANTDMVVPGLPDLSEMLEFHRSSGAAWTVLVGNFPESAEERYSPLFVDSGGRVCAGGNGSRMHYLGICLVEPIVSRILAMNQCSGGFFGEPARLVAREAGNPYAFHHRGEWLDMGDIAFLRNNILKGGNFIHPDADVSPDAVLRGNWYVGNGCVVKAGGSIRDGVMLDGSVLEKEDVLERAILPWYCSSRDGCLV